jgi:hypothetical protein
LSVADLLMQPDGLRHNTLLNIRKKALQAGNIVPGFPPPNPFIFV